MVAILVFIIATLAIVLGRTKLTDAKGPLGDKVIKNSARYMGNFLILRLFLRVPGSRPTPLVVVTI